VSGRPQPLPPARVRRVVAAVLAGERRRARMSVTFLGRDAMRRLNALHLGRDRPTDVISFGLRHPGGELVGDVYVCPRVARRNAPEHAGTYESPEPHPDITATDWIWSDKDKVKRWQRTGFFIDKTLDFAKRQKAAGKPFFAQVMTTSNHRPYTFPEGRGPWPQSPVRGPRVRVARRRRVACRRARRRLPR